ncbi:MAG: SpoIID/LytB domain-containing protein [Planctomycetota bacterium]
MGLAASLPRGGSTPLGIRATRLWIIGLLLASGALMPRALSAESDGPVIGVALHRGGPVMIGSADQRLRVESRDFAEELAPGRQELRFLEDEAYFGGWQFRSALRIRASDGVTAVGDRRYEGWIEVLPPNKAGEPWLVVNRLPMERYLVGVVGNEMPRSFEPAALAAQAIASRTYALYQLMSRAQGTRVHVSASTASQVYRGVETDARVRAAVASTRGQVLLFDGHLFESFFSSTCGGATASGAEILNAPRIRPLEPVVCGYCAGTQYAAWTLDLPEPRVRAALAPFCQEHGIVLETIRTIAPVEVGPGGHASYVRIDHTGGSFELDAGAFRRQLGTDVIYSTSFTCRLSDERLHFEGHGYGHGVGMCQVGAQALAKDGRDPVAIVQFYYEGASVVVLWE